MDGMNSYFEREKRKLAPNALNPMAKEYEPASCKTQEQRDWSMPQSKQQAMETSKVVQPATTSDWVTQNRKQHMDNQHKDQLSSGDAVSIMRKQNEITVALVDQQHLLSLPARDIPAF